MRLGQYPERELEELLALGHESRSFCEPSLTVRILPSLTVRLDGSETAPPRVSVGPFGLWGDVVVVWVVTVG